MIDDYFFEIIQHFFLPHHSAYQELHQFLLTILLTQCIHYLLSYHGERRCNDWLSKLSKLFRFADRRQSCYNNGEEFLRRGANTTCLL